MGELAESLDVMGTVERAEVLNTIFNKNDLKSVNALLDTPTDRLNSLSDTIANSTGTAADIAAVMASGLGASFLIIK